MIRKLQQLRCKKGFTLVELIIATAIMAVLIACVAAFAVPIASMTRATSISADALNVNKIIGDYIEGRLSFSSSLKIYYGVDSSAANAVFNTAAKDVATLSTATKRNGGGGKAGALVFKYTPGPAGFPELSSYRLYDVNIASTATTYTAPDLTNDAVFSDDFYGKTQRLIITPLTVREAATRSAYFMEMDIYSYNGSNEYATGSDPIYIQPHSAPGGSTLEKAYTYKKYTDNPAGFASVPEDVLNKLGRIRSGPVEKLAFKLNNIKSLEELDPDKKTIKSAAEAGTGVTAGADIVIFYYVPNFNF